MGHDVTVIGSANLDLVVPVPRIPAPGETVLAGAGVARHAGGKGLNQAVAAARAGARTTFVGAVGDDDAGDLLLDALRAAGVATGAVVRRAGWASGAAHITVRPDGENAIVVLPGANGGWCDLPGPARDAVGGGTVLLAQLEVDVAAVAAAAALARQAGRTVVLNAAPVPGDRDAVLDLLPLVDVLLVNQGEAAALAAPEDAPWTDADDRAEAAARGLSSPDRDVVVTLGGDGALLAARDGSVRRVRSPRVPVVDTTGAGDAFAGALAAATALGAPLPVALDRACAAGALAVQVAGAVPSLPLRSDVDALLAQGG